MRFPDRHGIFALMIHKVHTPKYSYLTKTQKTHEAVGCNKKNKKIFKKFIVLLYMVELNLSKYNNNSNKSFQFH